MKNCILLLLITLTTNAFAARDFKQVNIEVTPAAGDVFMLQGAGGNIAVLATDNGLLLVDDQFAPLATKIEQAMNKLSNGAIKYIVNTHFHGDHTGGNHYFSHKAPIFAHKMFEPVSITNGRKITTLITTILYRLLPISKELTFI